MSTVSEQEELLEKEKDPRPSKNEEQKKLDKKARLAKVLRENLMKRKAQQRSRQKM